MKAILEFNLPEDADEHRLAMDGAKHSMVVEELDNWLRGLAKYQDQETVTIEEVRTKIREIQLELGL